MKKSPLCPCQSQLPFADCCAPYLTFQKNANTPEALMRSRYSAYVTQNVDYLIATWHPQTLPKTLSAEIAEAKWINLKIISNKIDPQNENQSFVEFVATYKNKNGKAEKMHEKSRFVKQNDHWFYVDGIMK